MKMLCLLAAAAATAVHFAPTGKIWLEGDSTLHRYHATATRWQLQADRAGHALVVEIPVRGLKSGEGALDENLYKALKADQFPTISFAAANCRVGAAGIDADGQLSVAGQTRPVRVHAQGDLAHLTGTVALRMSQFGVQPPVLLAGAIRCSDAITVHFDLAGR